MWWLPIALVAVALFACEPADEGAVEPDEDARADSDGEGDTGQGQLDCPTSDDEPLGLILTWQGDPTTTMTIDWHVDDDQGERSSICVKAGGEDGWQDEIDAELLEYPFGDRKIYRTELTGLDPGATYAFQVGEFERVFRFRTMPEDIEEQPLIFATGGDTQHVPEWFEQTNRTAMEYDLDFIAWGGDLAYADGGTSSFHREQWEAWLKTAMASLIDDEGRVVPVLTAIGNHELAEGYYFDHDDYEDSDSWREEAAPYFYTFFAFPGHPGYGAIDFGDYLSLLLLDSDHSAPIEGAQTEWLEAELEKRSQEQIPHVFPIYHVPAYPSHRSFDGAVETRVRQNWVPLFEEYGVELAFENHDHTYKRTQPIRDGEVNDDGGVVYIGDGAWGVMTRGGDQKEAWYIEQFASERHAIIVTLLGDERHILVVSEDGEVIDEVGDPL